MTYSQLLQKLQKFGLEQISRMIIGDYDSVLIGRPNDFVFPSPPKNAYRIILDKGKGIDTIIDEEIIESILRRFNKTQEEFDPPM